MAASETIRTFISLELPGSVKQAVEGLKEHLMASGGDVKWVKIQGLHLTLKFLGQIPSEKVPAITGALDPIAVRERLFKVTLKGVGAFPSLRNPRVVWVGLEGDNRLARLQSYVEDAITRLGFESETRPFKPHLTLGRVRSPRRRQALIDALESKAAWESGTCELSEISLMKSELKPGGVVYTPLWSKGLAG